MKDVVGREEQDLNDLEDLPPCFSALESLKRRSMTLETKYYTSPLEFWIIEPGDIEILKPLLDDLEAQSFILFFSSLDVWISFLSFLPRVLFVQSD